MQIPQDLITAVAERRVIPFLGAGFSASVGMPDWGQLLKRLAEETEGSLPYADLQRLTGDDYLQIAEYLYLKSDQRIGPLRHVIERGLPNNVDPTLSAAHVELVNLGAPQIYTTNYDDLIEATYRRLGLPCSVVALGRDVAVAGQQTTQVVKYHGDLRHESTLVLTESSYFRRLDFESAMDVKFRADLLGRSVLFMGYSFRDINIRLIWFKLNQMMEDIPTADRRQSYIVRLEPNPVLEELYEAVGLKTIVLDAPPHSDAPRQAWNPFGARRLTTNLATFIADLASSARGANSNIPGSDFTPFVTTVLVERIERECDRYERQEPGDQDIYFRMSSPGIIQEVFTRRIPESLRGRINALYPRILRLPIRNSSVIFLALTHVQSAGPSTLLTSSVVNILTGAFNGTHLSPDIPGKLLESSDIDWPKVWSATIALGDGVKLLDLFEREINWNGEGNADEDLIYLAYLAKRISTAGLVDPGEDDIQSLHKRASDLLERASEIYPAIKKLEITTQAPDLRTLQQDVTDRKNTLPDQEGEFYTNYEPTFEEYQ